MHIRMFVYRKNITPKAVQEDINSCILNSNCEDFNTIFVLECRDRRKDHKQQDKLPGIFRWMTGFIQHALSSIKVTCRQLIWIYVVSKI